MFLTYTWPYTMFRSTHFVAVWRYTPANTQERGLLLASCPRPLTQYIQLLAYQDAVVSEWNQWKRQAVVNHALTNTHTHTQTCYIMWFFGAFTKLRKATKSFVMSVRLSRMKQLGSHLTDFHDIWYLRISRKSVEKIQVSLKSDKNKGYFTWRPMYIFYHISLISS